MGDTMTKITTTTIALLMLAACSSDSEPQSTISYNEVCDALATASCDRYEECDYWLQGINGDVVFSWTSDDRWNCEFDAWIGCIDALDTSGNPAPVDPEDVAECLRLSADPNTRVCEQPPAICRAVCSAIDNENQAEIYDAAGDLYIWVTCVSPYVY